MVDMAPSFLMVVFEHLKCIMTNLNYSDFVLFHGNQALFYNAGTPPNCLVAYQVAMYLWDEGNPWNRGGSKLETA